MTITPDKKYNDRRDNSIRPSWAKNKDYVNNKHQEIFNETKDIPGWQMEADTYKLYEMGYFAGEVILEIGTFGGRSAVVELSAALNRFAKPQFFGIDVGIAEIERTYNTLKQYNLTDYALLYHGTLQSFMKEYTITPTMCFVDGDHLYEGAKRDLDSLSEMLCPGVPVLCHDYLNPENDTGEYGIRKAASEWEADGYASFYGVFGCSALFVTSDKCTGRKVSLSAEKFTHHRKTLMMSYGLESTEPSVEIVDIFQKPQSTCCPKTNRLRRFLSHSLQQTRKKWD